MHLYLARHGESIANIKWPNYDFPGEINSSLTPVGEKQAESLRDWMTKQVPLVDAIYTSTLRRTVQTAQILAHGYDLPVKHDDRIREGGYSFWDHRPIPDELLQVVKDTDFHQRPHSPFNADLEGMESYLHLRARVGQFLELLVENFQGKTVLVVTHGWTTNAFLDILMNVGVYRRCYALLEYTALSHFEYVGEGQEFGPWWMYYVAQSEHLALAGLSKSLKG